MAFKFAIDDRGTSVPPRSQVGRLSTDLDEGMKVTLSDGEQVSWNPPPANPVIPDLSKVKQLAKYFNRGGFQPYPAWFYHPTEEPAICKNAEEAAEIGVGYREATEEERQRFGLRALWDWNDDSPRAQSLGREQPSSTQTSRGRERTMFRPHRAPHRRSAIWPTILSRGSRRLLQARCMVLAARPSRLRSMMLSGRSLLLSRHGRRPRKRWLIWRTRSGRAAWQGRSASRTTPDVLEAIALNDEHKVVVSSRRSGSASKLTSVGAWSA